MNLAACANLSCGPETRVWYRAIELKFWQTALQTSHTRQIRSRYCEGPGAARPFEILYLAEDHQTALFEVEALFGAPFPSPASTLIANPQLEDKWVFAKADFVAAHRRNNNGDGRVNPRRLRFARGQRET